MRNEIKYRACELI